jgi:hypothetical protein
LGPVRREAEPPSDGEPSVEQVSSGADRSTFEMPGESEADDEPAALGSVSQETVEIDMERALAEGAVEPELRAGTQEREEAGAGRPTRAEVSSGDSLEWEMPGDRAQDETPTAGEVDDEEQVEDVLEETPDFLRETPEHERLWFEQRPPRDFDFNE